MDTTKLSSKGQVIIPKSLRVTYHWETGQELLVIPTEDGVLLKPKAPFAESTLDEVAGCLRYTGQPKREEDMDAAIAQGVRSAWRDRG